MRLYFTSLLAIMGLWIALIHMQNLCCVCLSSPFMSVTPVALDLSNVLIQLFLPEVNQYRGFLDCGKLEITDAYVCAHQRIGYSVFPNESRKVPDYFLPFSYPSHLISSLKSSSLFFSVKKDGHLLEI